MDMNNKGNKPTYGSARSQGARLRPTARWLIGGLLILLSVTVIGLAGCSSQSGTQQGAQNTAAPEITKEIELPDWVQAGSEKVEAAYIAATLHAEQLQYIPCYCSCGQFGHTSVLDCFISGRDASGAPVYDTHASY